jgi:hypothetical protein
VNTHILNISTRDALKIDIKTFCSNINPYISVDGYRLYLVPNNDVFDSSWLANVNSKLPSPLQDISFVFVRAPNLNLLPHQDLFPPERGFIYGLNYILDGSEDTFMTYYKPEYDHTFPLTRYPTGPLSETERVVVPKDNLLLINTAAYHSVTVGSGERWCMSLRPLDSIYESGDPMRWTQVEEKYFSLFS